MNLAAKIKDQTLKMLSNHGINRLAYDAICGNVEVLPIEINNNTRYIKTVPLKFGIVCVIQEYHLLLCGLSLLFFITNKLFWFTELIPLLSSISV